MLYPATPERMTYMRRAAAAWIRMTEARGAGARGPAREDVERYARNMSLADRDGGSAVGLDVWTEQALTAFTVRA